MESTSAAPQLDLFLVVIGVFAVCALIGSGYFIVRHLCRIRQRARNPAFVIDEELGLN
jgi:flagellar biogenesis protein FliO